MMILSYLTRWFFLEQLTQTIEYALVELQVIEKLQLGNQVLSQIHKEMDLEKVEKIMDDTADGIAYQKEIEETMAQSFSPEDEEDIMKELDRLVEQEVCLSQSINVTNPNRTFKATEQIKILPTVPRNDKVDDSFVDNQINQLPSVPTTIRSEKTAVGVATVIPETV
jgi:phage terminase small subunit